MTPRISATTFSLNLARNGHKHKARFYGQQVAVTLFTPFGIEKRRAQLTAASVIITQNNVGSALCRIPALWA